MPCGINDALALLDQLEEVRRTELTRYTKLEVGGHAFGYLWYPTRTIGLKQTLAEQLALTAERPNVFEVQFTRKLRSGGAQRLQTVAEGKGDAFQHGLRQRGAVQLVAKPGERRRGSPIIVRRALAGEIRQEGDAASAPSACRRVRRSTRRRPCR